MEANCAFDFNTRIFKELDALGGFVDDAPSLLPGAAHNPGVNSAESNSTGSASDKGAAVCPFAALAASGTPMPAGHPHLKSSVINASVGPQSLDGNSLLRGNRTIFLTAFI